MQKYPAARQAVASVLADVREAADLSQRQLSKKLGEVVNYAHMIEASRQAISAEELLAWAAACGISASLVMKRAEGLLKAHSAMPKREMRRPARSKKTKEP